ncbi:hypothetical protein HPB47_014192 [Ixodes persulcatus]|uniref:Uncharacterized protein n=1 Tax=Ixodes persulcatus TaxID=34615 RepID=A0AC60QWJ6_IXOPE|nr:hypothetical protein HPB47_014192 [Ixodes persulcatus]
MGGAVVCNKDDFPALTGKSHILFSQPATSPSLRVVGTRLEVDFGPADPGAQLLLLLLPDPGQGCLSPRALVSCRENITVSGPAANVSSLHPVEVGRSPPATATPGGCSSWNATIVVTASYMSSWVEADVQVHQWPRCRHQFRVGLWEVLQPPGPGEEPCVFDIAIVQEVQRSLEGVNSSVVHFENMTAGNYCVRVTPMCPGSSDCLTLFSKVVELPGKCSSTFDRVVSTLSRGRLLSRARHFWTEADLAPRSSRPRSARAFCAVRSKGRFRFSQDCSPVRHAT